MALLPGGKNFYGSVKINFSLNFLPDNEIFLDFSGEKVYCLQINGNKVE